MVNVFSSDHKQATAGSGTLAVTSPMRLVIVNLMYVEIACYVYTTTGKRRKRYVGASALPASHRYSNAAVIRYEHYRRNEEKKLCLSPTLRNT